MDKIKLLGLAIFGALAPIHPVMLVTGALIFIDLGCGIWRAKKRGENIDSSGLRRTITKLFAYQVVIVTGYMIETVIMVGFLDLPITKIIASFIALTELKSILENISIITGIDFWTAIKDKLQPPKDDK